MCLVWHTLFLFKTIVVVLESRNKFLPPSGRLVLCVLIESRVGLDLKFVYLQCTLNVKFLRIKILFFRLWVSLSEGFSQFLLLACF